MIFVPCAHVVLVCNSCQQPCPAHIGRTLPALFFLYGVNTPNHSENDRGSRFAVNIRHCLRSFSLFYFVSRPIDFEKYILYRKGGTQNERTGKTQGNRAAHYTPAQGKTHPAQFAVSAVQCAHPAQAPLSPAREEGLRMPEHIRQEPKVLVSTENLTEQEWLAYRRQGIGGSDVAAILGISPFRTARDLYDDKLNIASAVDDTGNWVALEMGHLLEPLVAQIFTKKTGLEVFQIKKMFQHPQYPFMLADVDYFVRLPNGEIALLEIKTTNYNAKDHWWKDGEEYVPVYYETQGRHYMAVMDMDEIFYCCLYGNNEDEAIIRHLYRDREYEQEMVYGRYYISLLINILSAATLNPPEDENLFSSPLLCRIYNICKNDVYFGSNAPGFSYIFLYLLDRLYTENERSDFTKDFLKKILSLNIVNCYISDFSKIPTGLVSRSALNALAEDYYLIISSDDTY